MSGIKSSNKTPYPGIAIVALALCAILVGVVISGCSLLTSPATPAPTPAVTVTSAAQAPIVPMTIPPVATAPEKPCATPSGQITSPKEGQKIDGNGITAVKVTITCLPQGNSLRLVDVADKIYPTETSDPVVIGNKVIFQDEKIGETGEQNAAVTMLVVGGTRACTDAIDKGQPLRQLPAACSPVDYTEVTSSR